MLSCCALIIEVAEVEAELVQLKKTAAGPSGIPFWVYSMCAPVLAPVITGLFQNCLVTQTFPKVFKRELISPIPKIRNAKACRDYRPISVTEILARVFERVLLRRYLERVLNHIPTDQHGFQQRRSTLTALIDLHSKLLQELSSSGGAFLATIDLSKAFDQVRHSICIENALYMGVDHTIVNILRDFLKDRIKSVKIGNRQSRWRRVNRGIGQGTVQGPILFLIATAFLNICIPNIKYADDTSLVFPKNCSIAEIEITINKLAKSYGKIGLSLNADKTKIMPIGRSTPVSNQCVRLVRILGVSINSKLRVSEHILQKCKEVSSSIFALRRIKRDLRFSLATSEFLFVTVVLSKFLYGVEFWWPLLKLSDISLINRTIKRAKRYALVSNGFSIEHSVMGRQLRLFKKLCASDSLFKSPTLAYFGRRYVSPLIRTERDRRFFMNFMTFYCNDKRILV